MWILLNDSMLSIVRHRDLPGSLLVRARLTGDIERVFPSAQVIEGGGIDYRFRTTLPEAEVADAISRRLIETDYDNFKASVRDPKRHDAYSEVWGTLRTLGRADAARSRFADARSALGI